MSSITLNVADIFPAGTSVAAYPRSNWYGDTRPNGTPQGSSAATATVAADGTLTFASLTDGVPYFAYAQVSGVDKYRRFMPSTSPGSAGSSGVTIIPSGLDLTGATSSYDALQTAWSQLLAAGGGILQLPKGTINAAKAGVTSGGLFVVPAGFAGRLTVRGCGVDATTIKLGSSVVTMVLADPLATGPGTTFGRLTIEDVTVDNNNVSSTGGPRYGVVFGLGGRASVDDIKIRRVDTINVGTPATERRNVDITLISDFLGSDSYTCTRVAVEDCRFGRSGGGGAMGAIVQGFNASGGVTYGSAIAQTQRRANIYFDDIAFVNCWWDSGTPATAVASSVGFMIGGVGYGDRARFVNCYSANSWDDAYEVNGMNDVLFDNCVGKDAWSEVFYVRNIAAIINAAKQRVAFRSCRGIHVAKASTAFLVHSTQGVPIGHVSFRDCLSVTDGSPTGSGGSLPIIPAAIIVRAGVESVDIEGCQHIVRNWSRTENANSGVMQAASFEIRPLGGRTPVRVRGIHSDIQGTWNRSTFSSCTFELTAFKVEGVNDADLDIRGVTARRRITRPVTGGTYNTYMVKVLETNDAQFAQDTMVTDRIGADYLLDAGTLTDVAVTGGVLTSAANHGVEKRFRFFGNDVQYRNQIVGPATDMAPWMKFAYSQTAGHKGGVTFAIDAANYLEAYLTDDGTNSILNLDKVIAGTRTNLATTTLGARVADTTAYWVRLIKRDSTITVDYFTSAPSTLSVSTAGANTITATLTGADIMTLGGLVQGWPGFTWVPGVSSATADDFTVVRLHVLRGEITDVASLGEGVQAGAVLGPNTANGIQFPLNNTLARIPDLLFSDVDFRALTAAVTPVDYASLTGATGFGSTVTRRRHQYAVPLVPASITVTASPFTYTNSDGYEQDVSVYAGTVSAITVARSGGTAGQVKDSTGVTHRLGPGDTMTVTYTVAPTMRKVPVL